jgi:hypothetical protein
MQISGRSVKSGTCPFPGNVAYASPSTPRHTRAKRFAINLAGIRDNNEHADIHQAVLDMRHHGCQQCRCERVLLIGGSQAVSFATRQYSCVLFQSFRYSVC